MKFKRFIIMQDDMINAHLGYYFIAIEENLGHCITN
jgi:hypothetical protein